MTNVKMEKKGNNLIITVNLNEDHGPSSSGKTTVIATTHGGVSVAGREDVKVNLNVYRSLRQAA